MGIDWNQKKKIVLAGFKKAGQDAVVLHSIAGNYNVTTGKNSVETTNSYDAIVITDTFEKPDNEIILVTDVLVKAYMIDDFDIEEHKNLKIMIGTKLYDIINIIPKAPGGVVLYYGLQCRR